MNFKKDLPGALIRFQPDDLRAYEGEPWDIRISLGDAPLEEAFYITVRDRQPTDMTLEEVLRQYVLDRERRFELEIEQFPQLPNLQEELIQHWEASRKGAAGLEIWVNHAPGEAPVDLQEPVEDWISTCTFEDGSFDYRLLDLVWRVEPPVPSPEALVELAQTYGALFALLLLDFRKSMQPGNFDTWIRSKPFRPFLTGRPSQETSKWTAALTAALELGWIETVPDTLTLGLPGKETPRIVSITPKGLIHANSLKQEMARLADEYNPFASVWAYPPTLGVPEGFDARLQFMRRREKDFLTSVLLMNLDARQESILEAPSALEDWETGRTFELLLAGLAFETSFSEETLKRLEQLAAQNGTPSHS